jgi:hypothetical protein
MNQEATFQPIPLVHLLTEREVVLDKHPVFALRLLTPNELQAVAGGPKVVNDGP